MRDREELGVRIHAVASAAQASTQTFRDGAVRWVVGIDEDVKLVAGLHQHEMRFGQLCDPLSASEFVRDVVDDIFAVAVVFDHFSRDTDRTPAKPPIRERAHDHAHEDERAEPNRDPFFPGHGRATMLDIAAYVVENGTDVHARMV